MSAPAAPATRARVATSVAFGSQGFVFALVLTSLSQLKERFDLTDLHVTAFVLGVCVFAAVGTVVADRVARTGGSRVALAAGLVVIGVAVAGVAVSPTFVVLGAAFALYGLGLGLVDAGTNMQAVAVEHAYGRSLLTGFHGSWSVGGIAGALVVSATAGRVANDPVGLVLLVGPVVAVVAAVVVLRRGWRGPGASVDVDAAALPALAARPLVPWGPVLVLGVGVVAYYVSDQAISTWSTIYLDGPLGASAQVAPLGYAAYLGTTLASRLVGDLVVRRRGRAFVVRTGGLVGLVGLVLVVAAPSVPVALLGFAVVGAGLGVIAPLCFAAAGALAPDGADAVVARLNVFNYVGAVLGGVFVGLIGSASTLRIGFLVPIVLVAVVVAIAGRFDRGPVVAAPRVEAGAA